MFINYDYINSILEETKNPTKDTVNLVLEKLSKKEKLSHKDIAVLLHCEDKEQLEEMFKIAGEIKNEIYGKRVVIFAPLYVSDYCVNNCTYCGYKRDNKFCRRKLTMDEVKEEVKILEEMGHKRLALELGEDPVNAPIEYVLDCLDTIYSTQKNNGEIRRVNVNIAATTVENYKKLHDAKIGTYILFQETYDFKVYEKMHPKSIKGNYEYHLTAFDRAMEGGIDDVGAGVLFGLADPKFEVLGLMIHNEHLEEKYNVGFHTISVPRLRAAESVNLDNYPNLLSDDMFKKVVAILRLAVPFTGIILSTRESASMRKELLKYGVSQISAGSSTGVGGYKEREENNYSNTQFKTSDERTPIDILKDVLKDGYIPSYCTACYRKGRTGDRFMQLAKSGKIKYVCEPNALMTLYEFVVDYGDEELYNLAVKVIEKEIENIERNDIKKLVRENLLKIKEGKRDLYL